MIKPLIIICAGSVGGHLAYNLNAYDLEEYTLIGFLDDDQKKINKNFFGYPVLGPVDHILSLSKDVSVIIGVAFPLMKQNLISKLNRIGNFNFPSLVSKSAWVSNEVKIGKGVIVYPGCSINYGSTIGAFSVLNMNCAIGHDCQIGECSSLAPGVNLAGHTKIGNFVDMGIGSATIQDIAIGSNSIIGGQCMVIRNVNPGSKIKGVPGK